MPGGATKNESIEIPNPAGAMSIKMVGTELPDKKGGFMAMSMTLPPDAQLIDPRQFLNLALSAAEQQPAGGAPPGGAAGAEWLTKDEYLSGHIQAKLMAAEAAALLDESFTENIAALRAALPEPLGALAVGSPV